MAEILTSFDTIALPWWSAIALVLLIALLTAMAGLRGGWLRVSGALVQSALVLIGLFFAWNYFDRLNTGERIAERRAFEARLAQLNAQALAPGSPLACLESLAGEAADEPCERALFASAEAASAAVAYAAAKVALLREAAGNAGEEGYDSAIGQLRAALERDRFGVVAQALSVREHCSVERCEALALFEDSARIAANLREQTFIVHLGRHVARWGGVRDAPAAPALAAAQPAAPAPTPATSAVNVNFPSADSIPAVSIMNNEPGMSGQTGVEPRPGEAKPSETKPGEAKPSEAKPSEAKPLPPRRATAAAPAAPRPAARTAPAQATPAPAAPAAGPAQ